MELLGVLCAREHHPAFTVGLLGLPITSPKAPREKRLPQSLRQSRFKLPRGPPVDTRNRAGNRALGDSASVLHGSGQETISIPCHPPSIPTPQVDLDEPPSQRSSVPIQSDVNHFFRVVIKQSSSHLLRFLRSNAQRIQINQSLDDPSLSQRGGPFCGWTALHIAAFKGDIQMAQILLDHGAKVNQPASLQTEVSRALLVSDSTSNEK